MTVQIDQNFSVYQFIQPSAIQNIFSDKRKMLAYWSASIEKAVIDQSIPLTLFAGFQELDYFMPVMERYQSIAKFANHIYIFGTHSHKIEPIPNVTYIPLTYHDQLYNEWFLVAHHQDYSRALIALDTSSLNTRQQDRCFDGVLTSDVEVIEPIYQALMAQVVPTA